MATMRLYAALCLIFGCTCEAGPQPPRPEPSGEEAGQVLFRFADLRRTNEDVPARFRAALPTSIDGWQIWGDGFPPRAYVEDLLLSSSDMRDRFGAALASALEAGASMEELLAVHGTMVRWLEPDECGWLGEWAEREETPAAARPFFWIEFASCLPLGDEAPFQGNDLPPRAILARYAAQLNATQVAETPNEERMLSPRLVETLRRVLERECRTEDFAVTLVGVSILLRFDGGIDAALELRRRFPDAVDAIDPLLRGETNPEAVRLFDAYCRRNSEARECRTGGPRWARAPIPIPGGPPTTTTLAEEVRRYDFNARSFVADHPEQRIEVRDVLAECAAEDAFGAQTCLKQLALVDRPLARALAADFGSSTFAEMNALLRTLREDDDGTTLGRRMQAMGLITNVDEGAVTALDHLLLGGRALEFDLETGMVPNEHDSLLRRLAALHPETSVGVVFGEDVSGDMDGPYELHAWRDGQRWSCDAENLGDRYDLDAVLGMLNSLSRLAESNVRWLALTSEEQVVVVAGPDDVLQSAVNAGLIEPEARDADRP